VLWAYVRYISKIFGRWIWPSFIHFRARACRSGRCRGAVAGNVFGRVYFYGAPPALFVDRLVLVFGTLVPAIGIVQVGSQSMADRFTYVPSIGLFILVVWSVNDILISTPHKQKIAALLGTAALVGCLAMTSIQIKYWRSSITLFRHALAVTRDNYIAAPVSARL